MPYAALSRRIVALLAIALVAAACGGEAGLDEGAEGEAAAPDEGADGAPEGDGQITFVHWRGEDTDAFRGIIADFEEETGISVNMNVLPSDAYTSQVQSSLVAGEGADVFASFPGPQFLELADADVFLDITDEEFVDRFNAELIEAGQLDDRQLALPYQLVFNIPVYNKQLLADAGWQDPPEDWDGFLQLCDDLRDSGVDPLLFAGNVSPSQFINPMMMNNMPDEDIWERVEAGEARVDDEWMVTTLEQIVELQDRDCYQDDVLGTREEGAVALFAQEQGAMLALGSYMMATIAEQNPDIETGLLSPITVPAEEAEWEGIHTATFMLAVNERSPNQEEALQFLDHLASTEAASEYANATGQMLTVEEVDYETPELQEQEPWLEANTRFQPRFLISDGNIHDGLLTAVEDVLGGSSPEDAAADFQETVERALRN